MRLTTYISASVFIFMSAVIIKNNEAKHQTSALYDTKWSLHALKLGHQMEDVSSKAFIRFNEENKSVGGNGGCNSFGSSLTLTGHTLSITQLFSTKMYCEGVQEIENALFSNLRSVNRYEIKGGNLFLYKDKELLLEFSGSRED